MPEWSPDGRHLAHVNANDGGFTDLTFLNPADETTFEYNVSGANVTNPTFSPDGEWLVFASDELGEFEIYVARFPEFTDRRRISSGGGFFAVWNPNGKELFYWRGMDLISVPVEPDGRPATSGAVLFSLANEGVLVPSFDYEPRTDQFLVVLKQGEQPVRRIDIVLNWFEKLKRAMGESG